MELYKILAEGITYGDSWLDVITHLVERYGDDEMSEIFSLRIIGDGGPCLEKKDNPFKEEEK